MAVDRGAFIDQSQSLNIHIAEPNYGKLTSMHFYAWKSVSQINPIILVAQTWKCLEIGFHTCQHSLINRDCPYFDPPPPKKKPPQTMILPCVPIFAQICLD